MERSRRLDDDALAEEIELYGDLVVAATAADGTLPRAAIDRLLGLADEDEGEGGDDGDGGPGDTGRHPDGGAPRTAGADGGGA
jgi:hypothetical protein